MLAYDKKQIGRIHRILIPAVIFTAAVLLGRMDTIMADFGQSEPLAAGKALSFAFESLTTGDALLASGLISMIFTPKGLSVSSFVLRICSLTHSAGAAAAAISPKPPALETAAAR